MRHDGALGSAFALFTPSRAGAPDKTPAGAAALAGLRTGLGAA